jgi:hypothetical protein
MGLTIALFCIAAILSFLAAITAFLITYQEYVHHYLDKQELLKTSLRTAFFTFAIFLVLGSLLAIILPFIF